MCIYIYIYIYIYTHMAGRPRDRRHCAEALLDSRGRSAGAGELCRPSLARGASVERRRDLAVSQSEPIN